MVMQRLGGAEHRGACARLLARTFTNLIRDLSKRLWHAEPVQTTGTASTTSVLRVMNSRAVFAEVFRLGKASRPELAQTTGLSKPTVSLALTHLERAGLANHQRLRPAAIVVGGRHADDVCRHFQDQRIEKSAVDAKFG